MVLRIRITANETGTDSFLIYFLSGYFPWLIFSESLSRSVGVLLDNANLITKVIFPVELLPAATVSSVFIVNSIGMVIFWLYLIWQGYFHAIWISLILIFLLLYLFILGLANLLSALCVFIRDIKEILGLVLMVWFYATPIIYPVSMVPDIFKYIIEGNPMGECVKLTRSILLKHEMIWPTFFFFFGFSVCSFFLGTWCFSKAKRAFGDVL